MSDAKTPKRGRRAGDSGTREAVLAAAKARFATDGFAATTIRKVATDAGVDPALVMQFYHSKDVLFAASLAVSAAALARMADAFDGPPDGLGERVTRAFLSLWEEASADAAALMAMLRGAVSNEFASAQVRDFVQARLVEVISPKLQGRPDATRRAGFAIAMLMGLILGRDVVRIPTLAVEDQETVVRLVGPAIQAVLTGGGESG